MTGAPKLPGFPAAWSPCRRYRYTLWRTWQPELLRQPGPFRFIMVVGLNPSTADEDHDDPTVLRCWKRARALGFDAMVMTNLFAFRGTHPAAMKAQADPIGPQNDHWLRRLASDATAILVAWGTHGRHLGRDGDVLRLLPNPLALAINGDATPKHPLYVRNDQRLIRYSPAGVDPGYTRMQGHAREEFLPRRAPTSQRLRKP